MKKQMLAVLLTAAALLLAGCGQEQEPAVQETIDPYAGMVQVESGYGPKIWVEEYEELEVSPFLDWQPELPLPEGYTVQTGVDVSEHQGTLDWAAIAGAGCEFAIVRAGYRGYGTAGTLCTDACFADNLRGAREAGLALGVYFFSQATEPEEAEEEADYLLALLADYGPETFTLPVFFDWERIEFDHARTDAMGGELLTDCALAFCRRIAAAGYTPGVYAYRYLAYFDYDLLRLADYPMWIGALGERSDFYYTHDVWQYRVSTGHPGAAGELDLDYRFCPISEN